MKKNLFLIIFCLYSFTLYGEECIQSLLSNYLKGIKILKRDSFSVNGIQATLEDGKRYIVLGKTLVTHENIMSLLQQIKGKKIKHIDWLGEMEIARRVSKKSKDGHFSINKINDLAGFRVDKKLTARGDAPPKNAINSFEKLDKNILNNNLKVEHFLDGGKHVSKEAEISSFIRHDFYNHLSPLTMLSEIMFDATKLEMKDFNAHAKIVKQAVKKLFNLSTNKGGKLNVSWTTSDFLYFEILVDKLQFLKPLNNEEKQRLWELIGLLKKDFGESSNIEDILVIPL